MTMSVAVTNGHVLFPHFPEGRVFATGVSKAKLKLKAVVPTVIGAAAVCNQ
jgi:hypothetical protein